MLLPEGGFFIIVKFLKRMKT